MPIATLANYYFLLVFGLSVVFVFVLGFRFVFGLRLVFGFGLFLLNWIFFRHRDFSEPLVTESSESLLSCVCFGSGFFLGCGAVSSEDRSGPESSNKSKPLSERSYFTSR